MACPETISSNLVHEVPEPGLRDDLVRREELHAVRRGRRLRLRWSLAAHHLNNQSRDEKVTKEHTIDGYFSGDIRYGEIDKRMNDDSPGRACSRHESCAA